MPGQQQRLAANRLAAPEFVAADDARNLRGVPEKRLTRAAQGLRSVRSPPRAGGGLIHDDRAFPPARSAAYSFSTA